MKKLFTVLAVLLLALTLLWGCNENTDTPADIPLYYNLNQNAKLTPDASGVYSVDFVTGTEKKTFQVTDKALLDSLLKQDFVGLTLDGDTITGFTHMHKMPYSRLAWNYYVLSIGGNTVKFNALASYAGKELLLELPDNFPVYDVTPQAAEFGSATSLQKNDCVSIIADDTGAPLFCYVTSRPAVPREGKQYCKFCESEVSWLDWISSSTLPTSAGHYLLTDNVVMGRSATINGGQICLDLNGKTVTQATEGARIYALAGPATLSLMDSVGGGTIYPATSTEHSATKTGMCVYVDNYEAVLNMYDITMDASQTSALYGHGVSVGQGTFNLYSGTILGGTSFGPGSTAISANGTFNMYGGKVVGGKCTTTEYVNPIGGGAIRVLGTTTIYDGIIEGGESFVEGGVIRVSGDVYGIAKLTMLGGTVTGGKAPKGSGIYIATNGTVVLSGNVKITGSDGDNLYLGEGGALQIGDAGLGEEAEIGFSCWQTGEFLSEVPEGVDIAKHFTSDDSSRKIVKTGDGTWALK